MSHLEWFPMGDVGMVTQKRYSETNGKTGTQSKVQSDRDKAGWDDASESLLAHPFPVRTFVSGLNL